MTQTAKNKKLVSLEEMFASAGTPSLVSLPSGIGIRQELDIDKLDPYAEHKFSTYSGKRFEDMVESVRDFGVIQPIIVRKKGKRYEILAGHNRTNAAKAAGLSSVPAVIVDAEDDLAALIVTETNLVQRSFTDMAVSEKAKVLKTHCDNLKRAQKRKAFLKDTEDSGTNLSQTQNREIVGQEYGLTGRDVSRLIRVSYLTPQLQAYVDAKRIPLAAAVDLSYLSEASQEELAEYMAENNIKQVGMKTAAILRDTASQGMLFSVASVFEDEKAAKEQKKEQKENLLWYQKSDVYEQLENSKKELQDFLDADMPQPALLKRQIIVDALTMLYNHIK